MIIKSIVLPSSSPPSPFTILYCSSTSACWNYNHGSKYIMYKIYFTSNLKRFYILRIIIHIGLRLHGLAGAANGSTSSRYLFPWTYLILNRFSPANLDRWDTLLFWRSPKLLHISWCPAEGILYNAQCTEVQLSKTLNDRNIPVINGPESCLSLFQLSEESFPPNLQSCWASSTHQCWWKKLMNRVAYLIIN